MGGTERADRATETARAIGSGHWKWAQNLIFSFDKCNRKAHLTCRIIAAECYVGKVHYTGRLAASLKDSAVLLRPTPTRLS